MIVKVLVAYLAIAFVISVILDVTEEDMDMPVLVGIFWPVLLILGIIAGCRALIRSLLRRFGIE